MSFRAPAELDPALSRKGLGGALVMRDLHVMEQLSRDRAPNLCV